MNSIWTENATSPHFEMLNGNKNTDVLIIGGGIAGILCAHMLKKAGIDCILVEAGKICSGITKNTTAKITVGHGLIYDKLIKQIEQESAELYLKAQTMAMGEYDRSCKEIDCEFEKKPSYVYSLNDRKKIEDEVAALNKLGIKAELSDAPELPFKVAGAVCLRDQAQFHPLKFLFSISKDLPIFENTKVIELMPGRAITEHGVIKCKKMIIATHFPMLNKHGGFFLKLYQHRSYVIALEGAEKLDGMYVDEDKKGLSFRSYGEILLLGGGAHRTGKKGGNWQELERFARRYYTNAKIINKWATQDCMSLDGVPYIGQYSRNTPELFVATGFNKWGMTSAMVASMLICDLVLEKSNEFTEVFSPSRSILQPQLAVNAYEALVGLLTPTAPRCPHLGCALKYNRQEHSWDCPCHGSRFTKSGKLIDNPATDDNKNISGHPK